MDTIRQQVGGVRVPEIVEANAGQGGVGEQPYPFVGDAGWLERAAIGLRDNEGVVSHPRAELEKLLGLPDAVGSQLLNHD